MAFHPRGRFGPPYPERGGQSMRHGMPYRQRLIGPRGREQQRGIGRFPPFVRGAQGQFHGSRWPRIGFEKVRGEARGRGFVSTAQAPSPRFESITEIKDESSIVSSHKESELVGKWNPKEAPKSRGDSDQNLLQNKGPSIEMVMPNIKKEEGALRIELDKYNCDLHFDCDETGLVGWTLHNDGFECLWGGGRATYGVKRGKIAFETIVLEALPVQVPETERNPHVLRVGWSVDGADFQLGEDHLSYGYGGTGKISVNSKFSDYGHPFSVGDVITCCLDLDTKPRCIFYSLNGQYLGVAFNIGNELGDKALYPHITVKNMKFQVNFGGQWPKHPITPGFTMLQNVPHQDLIKAEEGPKCQQDAEVIMMVGLPSCGKTFWAEKYCKDNPEKRFYMLGTNNIIDKMRIFGLTRKRNYHGRWDALIKQATGCLNTWLKIAERRVRNYIIDQTNVYFTARRRKMNNFRGYKRIAIVVINEHKILADRSEKVEREEGKIIPVSAVMEMKANFSLPEVGESFDEVKYIEVKPPRALEFVKNYVEEGQAFKRGCGQSNERQEPRLKMPRIDSQGDYGGRTHLMKETNRTADFWSRTRQSYNDEKNNVAAHQLSSSGTDYNSKEGSHIWNRDTYRTTREPHRSTQEGSYNTWERGEGGNNGSYNDRRLLPRSSTRFDTKVKNEPFDDMQEYGKYDNRDLYHTNWKAGTQTDRMERNRNYSERSRFEHKQQDGNYQGYSSDVNYVPYFSQPSANQNFYSSQESSVKQEGSYYGPVRNQLDQNYGVQNMSDHSSQFVPSISRQNVVSSQTRPQQLSGYGAQNYTREKQSEPQQNYSSDQSYSWRGQDYQRQTYPTQQSHAYYHGIKNLQSNIESRGQGWQEACSYQKDDDRKEATYTRQQGYTEHQGQKKLPSYF